MLFRSGLLRKEPLLVVMFGIFILTLLGLPPFPSFFGKWELIMQLSGAGQTTWVIAILAGSFLEAVYLFKWFGYVLKGESNRPIINIKPEQIIAPVVFATIALMGGYYAGDFIGENNLINFSFNSGY